VTPWAIVDTGPLVAILNQREHHHAWAIEWFRQISPPMLVCEPVLVEALFLLAHLPSAQDALFRWLDKGVLDISFRLEDHHPSVWALFKKYRNVPMSLADGCLVRMAELHDRHAVFTLDSDFTIYRKHGRQSIPLITPQGS